MKTALTLIALCATSTSFAGFDNLPQYIYSDYKSDKPNFDLEQSLAKCRMVVESTKQTLKAEGYGIINETQCYFYSPQEMSPGEVRVYGSFSYVGNQDLNPHYIYSVYKSQSPQFDILKNLTDCQVSVAAAKSSLMALGYKIKNEISCYSYDPSMNGIGSSDVRIFGAIDFTKD